MKYLLVVVLIVLSGCATHPNKFKPQAEIKLQGDTIFYTGTITPTEVLNLIRKARNSEISISTLQINSGGGDIDAGIELGIWVHENNINVIVDTICFSSCANYVLTAASSTLVKSGAVIGWHGGAFQQGGWSSFNWYDHVNPRWVASVKKYNKSMIDHLRIIETDFFNKISVDQKITTYGQTKNNNCQSKKGTWGWHYHLSDLKHMGLAQFVLEDSKFNISSKDTKATSCKMVRIF